jgi:hypothetical protein
MQAGRTDTEFCAAAAMACRCLTWLTGYLSRLMTHDTFAMPDFVVQQNRLGERGITPDTSIVRLERILAAIRVILLSTGDEDIQVLPMGNKLIWRPDRCFP